MEPSLILGFLYKSKMECHNNSLHQEAAFWWFLFFMKKSAVAAFTAHFSLYGKSSHLTFKKRVLTSYCKVEKYQLDKYAKKYTMADTDSKASAMPSDGTCLHQNFLVHFGWRHLGAHKLTKNMSSRKSSSKNYSSPLGTTCGGIGAVKKCTKADTGTLYSVIEQAESPGDQQPVYTNTRLESNNRKFTWHRWTFINIASPKKSLRRRM